MSSRGLKLALALSLGFVAAAAQAAGGASEAPRIVYAPVHGQQKLVTKAGVIYHGGPVITKAHVVFLFWGPTFANASSADHTYATTLEADRNQFGTSPEYTVLDEYCGCDISTNLAAGTPDWFDTSTPPTNVTDSTVQSEVNKYLQNHTFDANAIYEVVIPKTSYSSSGGSTSCGGPALAYCAYHGWIGSGTGATKYSIQPYPSCSGCQVSGWSAVQNQEHFFCHETREAVIDPTGSTWFDNAGNEPDDKCAWSPTPFCVGGFCYQYEWSNKAGGCVQT